MSSKGGSAGSALFSVNEKVLCFHGPLIYEGKVLKLKAGKDDAENSYLIHYTGWSKKWDEFVPESRVLKMTEMNLKRQEEHVTALAESGVSATVGRKSMTKGGGGVLGKLLGSGNGSGGKKTGSIAGDSGSSVSAAPSSPAPLPEEKEKEAPTKSSGIKHKSTPSVEASSAKKKKLEVHVETELKFVSKQTVDLNIPDSLKVIMLDDYDMVVRKKMLVILPGRHSVESMLNDYMEFVKTRPETTDKDKWQPYLEYVNGVKDFFNIMIGAQLLYRFEREQYKAVLTGAKKVDPDMTEDEQVEMLSIIYGPIHLLRFYTKLESVLAFTTIEVLTFALFKKFTKDFLDFAVSKRDIYFEANDYTMSNPTYQRRSPC